MWSSLIAPIIVEMVTWLVLLPLGADGGGHGIPNAADTAKRPLITLEMSFVGRVRVHLDINTSPSVDMQLSGGRAASSAPRLHDTSIRIALGLAQTDQNGSVHLRFAWTIRLER
jgi:hypothetical protein